MSRPELVDSEHEEPIDEVDQYRMPLMDHLVELRTRMIRAFVVLFVAFCISMTFATEIIELLVAPANVAMTSLGHDGQVINLLDPFEGVYAWLRAGVLGGALLASPFLAWEVWGFVAPGLYKTERRVVLPLTVSSTLLFLLGAAFAYFAIFPLAFPFFFTVLGDDVGVTLSVERYLSSVVKMMLAFGVCFQLPIGAFFLARMGLIDHRDMISGFRYAIVGIFVVAALITPPDVLTQSLLALPLITLYGIGVLLARIFSTKVRVEDDGLG